MYKDRIRLWGLNKNNKANEIQAVLRLAVERERSGLPPAAGFQLGSRYVTVAEIHRYLRRKRIKNPRKWAREGQQTIEIQTSEPSIDLALTCERSRRSQAPTNIQGYSESKQIFTPTIPSSPAPRQEDLVIENVHRAVRAYCDSKLPYPWSFDWSSKRDPLRLCGLKSLMSLSDGIKALRMKRYTQAVSCWDRVFDFIKPMLEQDNPPMLPAIFIHLEILVDAGLGDWLFQFLRYLASMSTIVLGQQHPVQVMANSLIKSPPQLLQHAVVTGRSHLWRSRLLITIPSSRRLADMCSQMLLQPSRSMVEHIVSISDGIRQMINQLP